MAKAIPHAQMDITLTDIKTNANIMHGCSAQPANYAGIAAVSLGSVALSSSDFTIADGDTSGRKITVASKSITWSSPGNVTHFAIADTIGALLKGVTTVTLQAVTASSTNDIDAFDLWEIRDPI